MSKYQIKIDEPCHENWNAMSQKEQGRFCSVCAKDVVDFTAMSDKEVESYFINYKGSLCGRFNVSQLEQKDERYFNLTNYTKKFIRAFALVFLMFTAADTNAQSMGKPIIKGDVAYRGSYEITHKGVIFDADGNGISDVAISFYQNGVFIKSVKSTNNGSYSTTLKNGQYEMTIYKSGYQKITTDIQVSESGTIADFKLEAAKVQIIDRPIMGRIQIMGAPRMIRSDK